MIKQALGHQTWFQTNRSVCSFTAVSLSPSETRHRLLGCANPGSKCDKIAASLKTWHASMLENRKVAYADELTRQLAMVSRVSRCCQCVGFPRKQWAATCACGYRYHYWLVRAKTVSLDWLIKWDEMAIQSNDQATLGRCPKYLAIYAIYYFIEV